jgi:hypothetical protein
VQVHLPSASITEDYGFDGYNRIAGVTNGSYAVTYAYLANSDLLDTTLGLSSGSTVVTTKRGWDYGYRLRSIVNTVGGVAITGHNYAYDQLDRRVSAGLADGSMWAYHYDDRDELVSGIHLLTDSTPLAGQQFGYQFDTIGNRTSDTVGGDPLGGSIRSETYGVNQLNELTAKTNSPPHRNLWVNSSGSGSFPSV